MDDKQRLQDLLREALVYLEDRRLHWNELDGRRRRETAQQHEDRISGQIQENEDRRQLIDAIKREIGAELKRSDCRRNCDLDCNFPACLQAPNVRGKAETTAQPE